MRLPAECAQPEPNPLAHSAGILCRAMTWPQPPHQHCMHPPVFERIVNSFKRYSALEPGHSSILLGLVVAKSALWPRLKSKRLLAMIVGRRAEKPFAGTREPGSYRMPLRLVRRLSAVWASVSQKFSMAILPRTLPRVRAWRSGD